jgi:hypothetical protein
MALCVVSNQTCCCTPESPQALRQHPKSEVAERKYWIQKRHHYALSSKNGGMEANEAQ